MYREIQGKWKCIPLLFYRNEVKQNKNTQDHGFKIVNIMCFQTIRTKKSMEQHVAPRNFENLLVNVCVVSIW